MTQRRISTLLVLGSLLAVPIAGHAGEPAAPTSTPRVIRAAMEMAPADPVANGTKPIVLGVGAVLGYALMMNPYGTAVMGAAMGAMLAAEFYDTYAPGLSATSAK